ncbi:hypothetical protein [Kaarinaea lacus]
MEPFLEELIKQREIAFCPLHPDHQQAESASLLLVDIHGIHQVRPLSKHILHVQYNLEHICLQFIEQALREVGFHLDNSLFAKLKRAVFYYSEETQLANLGYDHPNSKSTTEIFINRYDQLKHGCRDTRPSHYRRYN